MLIQVIKWLVLSIFLVSAVGLILVFSSDYTYEPFFVRALPLSIVFSSALLGTVTIFLKEDKK